MEFPSSWLFILALLLPLPVGTDRPKRRVPWVTYSLIAINTIVFISNLMPGSITPDSRYFLQWGVVPGALEPVTLLTGIFFHVSLSHLFWNMVFLWIFGPHVEDAIGRLLFAMLFVGGGVAGAMLHAAIILIHSSSSYGPGMTEPLVGASGAISAILAPYAIRFHRSNIHMIWLPGFLLRRGWAQLEMPAATGLGAWVLVQLASAMYALRFPQSGETAYWAHIGGFIFGLVTAELTHMFSKGTQEYLLSDARGAAIQGQDLLFLSIQKYRGFLKTDPDNAEIRAELGRILLQHAGHAAPDAGDDRADAAKEMTTAIRTYAAAGRVKEAVELYAEAGGLHLALTLAPRELLHLANAAQELGDADSAEFILEDLLTDASDSAEAEMAQLKLGQILVKHDPARAKDVFREFLKRHPKSEWVWLVRELLAETERGGRPRPTPPPGK
jgi:membrane associated rhomboid family serine protease